MDNQPKIIDTDQNMVLAKQMAQSEMNQAQENTTVMMAKVMGTLKSLVDMLSQVEGNHDGKAPAKGAAKNLLEAKAKIALVSNWFSENSNMIGRGGEQQMLGPDGEKNTPASSLKELEVLKAEVHLVKGMISDLEKVLRFKGKEAVVKKLAEDPQKDLEVLVKFKAAKTAINDLKHVLKIKEKEAIIGKLLEDPKKDVEVVIKFKEAQAAVAVLKEAIDLKVDKAKLEFVVSHADQIIEVKKIHLEVEKDVAKLKKEVEVKVKEAVAKKILPYAKELFKIKKEVEGIEKLVSFGKKVLHVKELEAIAGHIDGGVKEVLAIKAYIGMVREAAGTVRTVIGDLPPAKKKELFNNLKFKVQMIKNEIYQLKHMSGAEFYNWELIHGLPMYDEATFKEIYGPQYEAMAKEEISNDLKNIGIEAAKIDAADRALHHHSILS